MVTVSAPCAASCETENVTVQYFLSLEYDFFKAIHKLLLGRIMMCRHNGYALGSDYYSEFAELSKLVFMEIIYKIMT